MVANLGEIRLVLARHKTKAWSNSITLYPVFEDEDYYDIGILKKFIVY
jgi:hypothetical protein